jgi:hypothetical protein
MTRVERRSAIVLGYVRGRREALFTSVQMMSLSTGWSGVLNDADGGRAGGRGRYKKKEEV